MEVSVSSFSTSASSLLGMSKVDGRARVRRRGRSVCSVAVERGWRVRVRTFAARFDDLVGESLRFANGGLFLAGCLRLFWAVVCRADCSGRGGECGVV